MAKIRHEKSVILHCHFFVVERDDPFGGGMVLVSQVSYGSGTVRPCGGETTCSCGVFSDLTYLRESKFPPFPSARETWNSVSYCE